MAAFFQNLMSKFRNYEEDDYSYEDADMPSISDNEVHFQPISISSDEPEGRTQPRVVDFRSGAMQQVVIVNPTRNESAQEICSHIQAGRTVVCNFERCDAASPQRILDFINGAAFALGGSVKRISSNIFLVAPRNVTLLNENEKVETNFSYLRQAAR